MPTTQTNVDRNTPMGANVLNGGVTFRVFAPAAREMYVLTGASLAAAQAPGFIPSPPIGSSTWETTPGARLSPVWAKAIPTASGWSATQALV